MLHHAKNARSMAYPNHDPDPGPNPSPNTSRSRSPNPTHGPRPNLYQVGNMSIEPFDKMFGTLIDSSKIAAWVMPAKG